MLPTNMPTPNIFDKYRQRLDKCKRKKVGNIVRESHNAILDEIVMHDGLEYDDKSEDSD